MLTLPGDFHFIWIWSLPRLLSLAQPWEQAELLLRRATLQGTQQSVLVNMLGIYWGNGLMV